MEIKLKGRELPRNTKGDVEFKWLEPDDAKTEVNSAWLSVTTVFSHAEIVELVNRALYQLEYQRESHRKRGQAERDRMKTLKAALKASGKDAKATLIDKQLKGE